MEHRVQDGSSPPPARAGYDAMEVKRCVEDLLRAATIDVMSDATEPSAPLQAAFTRLSEAGVGASSPCDPVAVSTVAQAMVDTRILPPGAQVNWPAFMRDARAAIAALRTLAAPLSDVSPTPSIALGKAAPLTADFENSLPDGGRDRCSYSDAEDALDQADAPMVESGRWLRLTERIALLGRRSAATANDA